MLENVLRSLMCGVLAGETLFLLFYPGCLSASGSRTGALKASFPIALAAFAVFASIMFVAGLFLVRAV